MKNMKVKGNKKKEKLAPVMVEQLNKDGKTEKVDSNLYQNKVKCQCGNVRYLKNADFAFMTNQGIPKLCKPCRAHKSKPKAGKPKSAKGAPASAKKEKSEGIKYANAEQIAKAKHCFCITGELDTVERRDLIENILPEAGMAGVRTVEQCTHLVLGNLKKKDSTLKLSSAKAMNKPVITEKKMNQLCGF